ncbi:NAD(+)/NADH kinase [Helicobacter mustelae]|nr:NAD(+)/NADH kinase [Helicobacter mustelae]SQH71916.1 ATP-NAD kinase [Helicobacter mustelae]
MQKSIRIIGVVLRPNTPHIIDLFSQIQKAFEKEGIKVLLERTEISKNVASLPFSEMVKQVDAMSSLGGDGTLISLMRRLYGCNLPAFGINIGNLGFLTATNPDSISSFAKILKNGDYKINAHMLLEAQIGTHHSIAVNEFLISKNNFLGGCLRIHAFIDEQQFNTYRADSLIIATPTGSTAYNISSGGSIAYPLCKNILLTPVAAHTLTQRPMVLHDSCNLNFRIDPQGSLITDGQEKIPLTKEDTLSIHAAKHPGYLIQAHDYNYFQILKEKFQWGQ